jgi:hypothetical protein
MEGSTTQSVPLLGATMEDALDAGLRKAGVFCSLCGRSASPPYEPPKIKDLEPGEGAVWTDSGPPTMTEYLVIDATIAPEVGKKPTVALARFYHCGREDCDATELRSQAQAARTVPAWEVLVPDDVAPPPGAPEPKFEVGDVVRPKGATHSPPAEIAARRWFEADEFGRAGWRYDLTLDGEPVAPVPFQESILQKEES